MEEFEKIRNGKEESFGSLEEVAGTGNYKGKVLRVMYMGAATKEISN